MKHRNTRYTKVVVVQVAAQATSYTDGAVRLGRAASAGNGLCYVDGHDKSLVWDTRRTTTAGRQAAAYYAGAARRWAELTGRPTKTMPPALRTALRELAHHGQPTAVLDAYRRGAERAAAAWQGSGQARVTRMLRAARAAENPGTARVGERRVLTLHNRDQLLIWSGGREPEDPGSDVLLIDHLDGSTLVVVPGQTVERTASRYRRVPAAELKAEVKRPSG